MSWLTQGPLEEVKGILKERLVDLGSHTLKQDSSEQEQPGFLAMLSFAL